MPILHKNINNSADIHNPKWFDSANNGDYAWRNELGVLESTDELVLPAALDFVDASVAPPTSNTGDIYVLSSGGSVNAGWGSVALKDWVRYDGAAWNEITPQKSTLCYNEADDKLLSYDGADWNILGGGDSIYTSSGTAFLDVEIEINDSLSFTDGTNKLWEWLDNGNVNIGNVSPVIELPKSITFNFPASSPGEFTIDGSNGATGASNVFVVKSVGTANQFDINQSGEIESDKITGNNPIIIVNSSGTCGFNFNTSVTRLYSSTFLTGKSSSDGNGIRQVFTSSSEEMKWQQANSTDYTHQIKSGTSTNIINFFRKGWGSSQGLIIGATARVGAEDISLQGDVLMNANVNMSNLPTSATGLSSGDLWNDAGTLKIA